MKELYLQSFSEKNAWEVPSLLLRRFFTNYVKQKIANHLTYRLSTSNLCQLCAN